MYQVRRTWYIAQRQTPADGKSSITFANQQPTIGIDDNDGVSDDTY